MPEEDGDGLHLGLLGGGSDVVEQEAGAAEVTALRGGPGEVEGGGGEGGGGRGEMKEG